MNEKITTIDELARMIQDQFTESKNHVDKQFIEVNKQFTEVRHELKAIRKELLGVVYRPEFDDLQDRVREMETALAMFKKKAV